jgi:hypothetical protein
METFGVTGTMIQNTVANLSLDPNSPPYVSVDEIIERNAAMVLGEARAHGITSWSDTDPSDLTYRNLQTMTLFASIAEILASKDRGMDRANYYTTKYNQLRAQLKANPLSIGPSNGTDRRGARIVADRAASNIDRLGIARRLMY